MFAPTITATLTALTFLASTCGYSKTPEPDNNDVYTGAVIDSTGYLAGQDKYWNLASEGGEILPLKVFKSLDNGRFSTPQNLQRFGFMPGGGKGLPAGMSLDKNGYVGINCIACHTTQMQVNGVEVRIAGGQAILDLDGFQKELLEAVKAQGGHESQPWFDAMKKRVWSLEQSDVTPVPGQMDAIGSMVNETLCIDLIDTANGHSLVAEDACQANNAPSQAGMVWGIDQIDWAQSNGAVHVPLWRNLLQAVGTQGRIAYVDNNLTIVGPDGSTGSEGLKKVIEKLDFFEQGYVRLKTPTWQDLIETTNIPEADSRELVKDYDEVLLRSTQFIKTSSLSNAQIERPILEAGQMIFEQQCLFCHSHLGQENSDLTRTNGTGLSKTVTTAEVGTDKAFLEDFATKEVQVKPEFVEVLRQIPAIDLPFTILDRNFFDLAFEIWTGRPYREGDSINSNVLRAVIVVAAMSNAGFNFANVSPQTDPVKKYGLMLSRLWTLGSVQPPESMLGFKIETLFSNRKFVRKFKLDQLDKYRARPLQGIAFSPPYLHHGAVRTLRELLKAPHLREKTFEAGSIEFDAVDVGFVSERIPDQTRTLDTSLRGQGNEGHNYGTDLSAWEKEALIAYLRAIEDFGCYSGDPDCKTMPRKASLTQY